MYILCLVDPPDDVGDEEDLVVEEDVVGSEDEMADFIVDEDDGLGAPKRYFFFFLLFISFVLLTYLLCHVHFLILVNLIFQGELEKKEI